MKYKGFLLATVGGVASISGAQAADLPMKAAPMYTPVATWTGLYGGVHLGAAWQLATARTAYSGDPEETIGKAYGAGFIGGGQIGYNWQTGSTVWGLEATISGLTGKATASNDWDNGVGSGHTIEGQIDWLATFRGRAGWLMHPDTLLYATGGLAIGGVKNLSNPRGLNGPPESATSVSKTKTGWVVGGGIEHKLDQKWSIALEGLYVDLGKSSGYNADSGKTSTFKNSAVIGQLKVNYKF